MIKYMLAFRRNCSSPLKTKQNKTTHMLSIVYKAHQLARLSYEHTYRGVGMYVHKNVHRRANIHENMKNANFYEQTIFYLFPTNN